MWYIIKILGWIKDGLIKDGLMRLTLMDGFNGISDII